MAMIHTSFLECVESLWPAGELIIVPIIYGMVKSLSFNKLKSILFPAGGNSGSYITMTGSQNGVDLRSSSHRIKLIRHKLRIKLSGYC